MTQHMETTPCFHIWMPMVEWNGGIEIGNYVFNEIICLGRATNLENHIFSGSQLKYLMFIQV